MTAISALSLKTTRVIFEIDEAYSLLSYWFVDMLFVMFVVAVGPAAPSALFINLPAQPTGLKDYMILV